MAGLMGRYRIPIMLNWGKKISGARMRSSVVEGSAVREEPGAVRQQLEAAAREDRLDFFTAAKILFSAPAKPKKFGLDFHLWQFFAACLPPFAVYLTAQYARHEIRRLEKERAQAEKLLLQSVVAEELDLRLSNEGNTAAADGAGERANLATRGQREETEAKKNDDAPVSVSQMDLLALKNRLDVLESKLNSLERIRTGTKIDVPVASRPSLSKDRPVSESSISREHDEHNEQKKGLQNSISKAELG